MFFLIQSLETGVISLQSWHVKQLLGGDCMVFVKNDVFLDQIGDILFAYPSRGVIAWP